MSMSQEEIERMLFFDHVCKTSEASYVKNPLDADNLTRWGSALAEMASNFPPPEAKIVLQDAILRLEEALKINPKKSITLCYLGNAYSSFGLLTPDAEEARLYFNKGTDYLTRACEEEPHVELYSKSLQMAAKAPKFHDQFQQQQASSASTGPSSSTNRPSAKVPEFHDQFQQQQASSAATGPSSSTIRPSSSTNRPSAKTATKKKNSDLMGWVILAVGVVAIAMYSKNHMPPPPR